MNLKVDNLLIRILKLRSHMHLKIVHRSELRVGISLVEQNEPTLVESLVNRLQIGYIQVDLVRDVQTVLVVARNVRRVVDVVRQVLGVDRLVTASRCTVMLEPVDENWR